MTYVIINALLYIFTLIIYFYKRRKIDVGFVLISIYAFVAIISVFLYASEPYVWKLKLWPFLYLFLISILFFRPYFFNSEFIYHKFRIKNHSLLRIISILVIVTGLIAVYFSITQAIINIREGEWLNLRIEQTNANIKIYSNPIERISKIIGQYLQPLAIVILFYSLTAKNKMNFKPITKLLLAISIVAPAFISSINIASRGMVFGLAFILFTSFLTFRTYIPKNTKRIIYITLASLFALMLSYTLAVTISRFGKVQQSSSLIFYFGQPMLTFNYGLADSIHTYLNGDYFGGWFVDKFNGTKSLMPIDHAKLGTHFGTAFFTFVGGWYLDFGPVGTFLIAIFIPMIMSSIFKLKNKIDIGDLYMYVFYLNYLVTGVFVVGRGYGLTWVIAFIIYGILKIIK